MRVRSLRFDLRLPIDDDAAASSGRRDATPPPIHPVATCGFDSKSFALATTASVGAQGVPFGTLGANDTCTSTSASFDYQILDVDGDGLPDLLVTSACNDPTVGPDAYVVYPNMSTGFGAPIRYALPNLSSTPGCVQAALVDIDGDYALDYVVTSLCTDVTVGTSQWLVYRNTGGAFATTTTSYTLPANATVHTFSSLEVDAASCTGNQPAYGFYDVTGDHIADIVETTACDDTTVGVTSWRVYPGSATGVGAPTAFTLPGLSVFPFPSQGTLAVALNFDTDLYGSRLRWRSKTGSSRDEELHGYERRRCVLVGLCEHGDWLFVATELADVAGACIAAGGCVFRHRFEHGMHDERDAQSHARGCRWRSKT